MTMLWGSVLQMLVMRCFVDGTCSHAQTIVGIAIELNEVQLPLNSYNAIVRVQKNKLISMHCTSTKVGNKYMGICSLQPSQ